MSDDGIRCKAALNDTFIKWLSCGSLIASTGSILKWGLIENSNPARELKVRPLMQGLA